MTSVAHEPASGPSPTKGLVLLTIQGTEAVEVLPPEEDPSRLGAVAQELVACQDLWAKTHARASQYKLKASHLEGEVKALQEKIESKFL